MTQTDNTPSPASEPAFDEGLVHGHFVIDGIRLHYVEKGQGPLVILLHGFPEFWYAWKRQISVLAEAGYRVIALDQRGYNDSDQPQEARHYRLEMLHQDLRGLLQVTGQKRATFIGHDWGGAIAWTFAMRFPEAVEKLVILNAPHPYRYMQELCTRVQLFKSWYVFFFQLPWLPEFFIRAFGFANLRRILRGNPLAPETFDEDSLQRFREALARPGALTAAINYYRALFRYDRGLVRQLIRPIDTPTLVIWGEQDPYLDVRLTDGLETWVPNLTLKRLPDLSHWVLAEAPTRVNRLILRFLNHGKSGAGK